VRRARAPACLLVFLALSLSVSGTVWPRSADTGLEQLNHRSFSWAEGAPTNIYDLAQTSDGTLWIGAGTGLTRFDGIHFVPYPGPAEEPLPSSNISTLTAGADGGLWIGYRLGGASFLKGGHLVNYSEADGLPGGTLQQFALDRDGSVWAAARGGIAHLKDKRWERVLGETEWGSGLGLLIDRLSNLWVATLNGLFVRKSGETVFREVTRPKFRENTTKSVLSTSPDGGIWVADDEGLRRIDPAADLERARAVGVRISGVAEGTLVFDSHGNLWCTTRKLNRLVRLTREELSDFSHDPVVVEPERFAQFDGFNKSQIYVALEDREHNVWVGSDVGLDRFSYSNVIRDHAHRCNSQALVAGDNGTLWKSCAVGDANFDSYVEEVRDGVVLSHLPTPGFDVSYRDPQGSIWFASGRALGHIEGGRIVSVSLPAQALGGAAQSVVRDSAGAIWVSVVRRGIFRLLNGEWSAYGNLDALPRGPAIIAAADSVGTLWFGYPGNRIARVREKSVDVFGAADGLELGNVLSILPRDDNVWVGGELGFARFDGKHFLSMKPASGPPLKGVSGIVIAGNGDLWLNGMSGISHIARQELERVVRDPTYHVQCETLDYLDGVPGSAVQLRPLPSALETTDGRVWFSMESEAVSIDVAHLDRNTLAPPVTIWSLTSDQKSYPNRGAELQLPAHTENLQIEYTSGSLTVPERVRFRYKLEGLDRKWQDVEGRREALYTNLRPGHYRFQVIASNNDGVWNNTGATIAFTIHPAFYQTNWFYALCALAGLAALTALYRVRVRQVAAEVRGRLEARLAERERIARELHDTLLQGMQGLIWRFQAATDRIPPGEPARQLMEQSLDRADKLLGESRDKVKDLRPSASEVADLAQAIATEGEQFAQLHPAQFRVSVSGARQDLHPIVREEGFLICREALANAFQHSAAKDIEAELTYGDTTLQIRIRDDGQGIDPAVLEKGGKPGHFGLIGMRERAKKLGGHLDVWSKPRAGTEIDLRVPAAVAYRRIGARSVKTRSWRAILRSVAR
jgi:signal transduction histidine kinase/ligand-binding sensor domain-containing protein